jgi:hypothetical protein
LIRKAEFFLGLRGSLRVRYGNLNTVGSTRYVTYVWYHVDYQGVRYLKTFFSHPFIQEKDPDPQQKVSDLEPNTRKKPQSKPRKVGMQLICSILGTLEMSFKGEEGDIQMKLPDHRLIFLLT